MMHSGEGRNVSTTSLPRNKTQRKNYQKVLLAVYMTAEEGGLCNVATNKQIGEQAGLTAITTAGYLRDLEHRGVIAIVRPGEYGISMRRIFLLDHPDARTRLEEFERYRNIPAWREA